MAEAGLLPADVHCVVMPHLTAKRLRMQRPGPEGRVQLAEAGSGLGDLPGVPCPKREGDLAMRPSAHQACIPR